MYDRIIISRIITLLLSEAFEVYYSFPSSDRTQKPQTTDCSGDDACVKLNSLEQ